MLASSTLYLLRCMHLFCIIMLVLQKPSSTLYCMLELSCGFTERHSHSPWRPLPRSAAGRPSLPGGGPANESRRTRRHGWRSSNRPVSCDARPPPCWREAAEERTGPGEGWEPSLVYTLGNYYRVLVLHSWMSFKWSHHFRFWPNAHAHKRSPRPNAHAHKRSLLLHNSMRNKAS